MMENRLIVFDVDGVILKSDQLYCSIANQVFNTNAVPMDFEKIITEGGPKLFDAVAGRKASSYDIDLFREAQITKFRPLTHIFKDVSDTLSLLCKSNILTILSNKPHVIIENILEKAQIRNYFKDIIGLDSGFPKKPSPDGLLYLMQKYAQSKPFFVGDTYSDYLTAERSGCEFIYCKYGFDDNVIEHQTTIENFSDLLRFFRNA